MSGSVRVCAEDVTVSGGNINTTKKIKEIISDAEKTKYVLISHHQNARQNLKLLTAISPSKSV